MDVFSGVGGMSLGAKMAGIEVHLAIEKDPHAAATCAHNHPETNVLAADISKTRKLKTGISLKKWGCRLRSYGNVKRKISQN